MAAAPVKTGGGPALAAAAAAAVIRQSRATSGRLGAGRGGSDMEVADLGLGADARDTAQSSQWERPGGWVVVHQVPGLYEVQAVMPRGQL